MAKRNTITEPLPVDDLTPPADSEEEIPDWVLNPKLNLPRAQWTVNGLPIPEHVDHLIHWQETDQGIRQAEYHRSEPSGVKITRDAWDNKLEARAELEAWEAPDMLAEAAAKCAKPGMQQRLLSPKVIGKRGMRGWKPSEDANGNRVTVGDMFLAEMPIAKAEARNKHYSDLAREEVASVANDLRAAQEKMIRDSGAQGISPLKKNERLSDFDDPDAGEVTIGASRRRGRAA